MGDDVLQGKTAIVTGAARGIGRAISQEFSRQRANVLMVDLNETLGAEAARDISNTSGGRVMFRRANVADEDEVHALFEFATQEFGSVDTLVNNAAVMILHEVRDFPLADWVKVFDVNMTGAFLCAKAAVNCMISRNTRGSILNISSASSRKADPEHAAYSASKAALLSFARILALEVGPHGIRVNSLLPGATETEMLAEVFGTVDGLKEDIVAKTVLGRLAQPTDIAEAAVFLCSDLASHITGEYLVVSGGEFFNP